MIRPSFGGWRWWGERVAPQVSTGNRTRATHMCCTQSDRYQGGGKPSPYYTRAWQADSLVYSRGDPLRSPFRIALFVAFASRVYGGEIYDKWWGDRVAPQVSTGNRTRATMKALPAAPHLPRPYRRGIYEGIYDRRKLQRENVCLINLSKIMS